MNVLKIALVALVLQAAQPQSQTALVEGRVVGPAGNPLSKVTVTLQGPNSTMPATAATLTPAQQAPHQTTVSSSEGSFSFDNLRPGTYKLTASRAGFTTSEFGQKGPNGPGIPISISPDQKLRSIVLTIAPLGAITGRIRDRDGMPVVRATVQALKVSYRGPLQGHTLSVVQSVTTDENGEYRLFWLAPGSYVIGTILNAIPSVTLASLLRPSVISISASPLTAPNVGTVVRKPRTDGSAEEEIEVPSYYPGTANFSDANRVVVGAGETVSGIDFSRRFSPSHRIRGVFTSPNLPGPPFYVVQFIHRKSSGDSSTYTSTSESGAFEISGVIAGDYLLNGLPIVVGDTDLDNLVLSSRTALISVEGKITLEGPEPGESARIVANRFEFFSLTYALASPISVQPDGSFRTNLAPGDYLVTMSGDPVTNARYLKSVRFGNQDGLDVLHISGNAESAMEIVLGSAKGNVDARVMDMRREPVLNATVVLIPNPPRRHRTDMYLTAAADSMGKIHFNAPPGEYKIFAWEDIEPGAWLDTDFMAKYEGRGQPVSIREGSQNAVDVTVIPYVP